MYTTLVLVVVCVLGVSAQEPKHCFSPPRWEAKLFEIDSQKTFDVVANITYDAIEERMRIDESVDKRSPETHERFDVFFFFKERTMYIVSLNETTKACEKKAIPDDDHFHPIGVPPDAESHGAAVIGTNAFPGAGVTLNLWSGHFPNGRYFVTVTDEGCLPVEEMNTFESHDVLRRSFYDVSLGFGPNEFKLPDFCN